MLFIIYRGCMSSKRYDRSSTDYRFKLVPSSLTHFTASSDAKYRNSRKQNFSAKLNASLIFRFIVFRKSTRSITTREILDRGSRYIEKKSAKEATMASDITYDIRASFVMEEALNSH